MSILRRIANLFHRSQLDQEIEAELRSHIEMRTADNIAAGMSPQEAQRAALVRFGNRAVLKERVTAMDAQMFLDSLWQDLCYGLRMLRKSPGFTAVAVLTLALGIGANTAIFSVIDAILLRPLPYKNPNQLVFVMESNPRSAFGEAEPSLPDINDWRASSKTIQQFAAFDWQNYFLTGGREPELVWGLRVSPEFFSTVGVQPWRGSAFSTKQVESGNRVAVISNALWQERFGGNPGVVGRTVVLNDAVYTIIGIMPPGFQFPPRDIIPGMDPQIFTPLIPTLQEAGQRGDRAFDVIARLKQGVSVQKAGAELSTIAASLAHQYPATNKGWGIGLTPVNEEAIGNMRLPLLILACAVGLVLLLACANVANLVLARNASRRQEISVRSALGASPFRIMRQMLTESFLLALAAAILGVVGAGWTLRLIVSAFPANIPRVSDIRVDATVFAFSLGVAVLTALTFGSIPAVRAVRLDVQKHLKGDAHFSARRNVSASNALVVFQVAASLMLLIGSGLLIHSLRRLLTNNPGFHANSVLTARLELPADRYRTGEAVESFHRRVLDRIRALPGVDSAAVVMELPLSGRSLVMYAQREVGRADTSAEPLPVEYNVVSAGYFETMRVPVLSGRAFSNRDTRDAQAVAIINDAMARQFWPHRDAIGQYFGFGSTPPLRVIGVVANEKYWSLANRGKPEFYLPYAEGVRFGATYLLRILTFLVVRSPLQPQVLSAEIRRAVRAVDPDQPVAEIKTMNRLVADSIAPQRFAALLLSILGGLAAFLALAGLFGLMAYTVAQRTHEIGIRMALGAQKAGALRMVIGQGLRLTLTGVSIGLIASLGLMRLISSLLFDVAATDPLTFMSVTVVLVAASLAACYIPARRAMNVDPMVALRHE